MSLKLRFRETPTGPFPGLRPFLEHEDSLMFGRDKHVRDIIAHLRNNHFVVVIGGSGCGKSSLVRAGVMPQLRSYAISDAGDLWIPVLSTPGTNLSQEGAGSTTPLERVARSFGQILKSLNEQESCLRETEIAAVLRTQDGISRLFNRYSADINDYFETKYAPPNILFVIDQFEEIFHDSGIYASSSSHHRDGALLIERLIEHSKNPNPRCFVALTMRSESLNECAAFLELPNAINSASYLVPRLSREEIEAAITKPVAAYWDMLGSAVSGSKPAVIERSLVELLIRDVQAIAPDPDHLPLLQHTLAVLWHTACSRSKAERNLGLPDRIEDADLEVAIAPALQSSSSSGVVSNNADRGSERNVLRICLENCAQRSYEGLADEGKVLVDRLLKRLAFKSFATGLFTQERIPAKQCLLIAGVSSSDEFEDKLRSYGYVGRADYLYWDSEGRSDACLKVSHEALIRGWQHFKDLVEARADQTDAFAFAMNQLSLAARNRGDRKGMEAVLDPMLVARLEESEVSTLLSSSLGRKELETNFRRRYGIGGQLKSNQSSRDLALQFVRSKKHNAKRAYWARMWRWLMIGVSAVFLAALAVALLLYLQNVTLERASLLYRAIIDLSALEQTDESTNADRSRENLIKLQDINKSLVGASALTAKSIGLIFFKDGSNTGYNFRSAKNTSKQTTEIYEALYETNRRTRELLAGSLVLDGSLERGDAKSSSLEVLTSSGKGCAEPEDSDWNRPAKEKSDVKFYGGPEHKNLVMKRVQTDGASQVLISLASSQKGCQEHYLGNYPESVDGYGGSKFRTYIITNHDFSLILVLVDQAVLPFRITWVIAEGQLRATVVPLTKIADPRIVPKMRAALDALKVDSSKVPVIRSDRGFDANATKNAPERHRISIGVGERDLVWGAFSDNFVRLGNSADGGAGYFGSNGFSELKDIGLRDKGSCGSSQPTVRRLWNEQRTLCFIVREAERGSPSLANSNGWDKSATRTHVLSAFGLLSEEAEDSQEGRNWIWLADLAFPHSQSMAKAKWYVGEKSGTGNCLDGANDIAVTQRTGWIGYRLESNGESGDAGNWIRPWSTSALLSVMCK